MKSTLTPSFSLPSLGANKVEKGRRLDQVELMKYVPGPGTYTPKLFIGDSKTVASNYQTSSQKSFYHHDRFPTNKSSPGKDIPGPGTYQTISDFNLYAPLTQSKMMKSHRVNNLNATSTVLQTSDLKPTTKTQSFVV